MKDLHNVYKKEHFTKLIDKINQSLIDENEEFFVHIRTKLEDIDVRKAKEIKAYLSFLKDLFSPLPDVAGISFEIVLRKYDALTFNLQQKLTQEINEDDKKPTGCENNPKSNEPYGQSKDREESDCTKT